MTDQQLKTGQDLKRIIATLEGELEKFNDPNQSGINVYLPNVGTLIDRVKIDFVKQLELYKQKFKEL